MNRRRFKLQVEAVLVVYRAQRRSKDVSSLPDIRRRGHEIFDELVDVAGGDPELERELADARRELEDGRPS